MIILEASRGRTGPTLFLKYEPNEVFRWSPVFRPAATAKGARHKVRVVPDV